MLKKEKKKKAREALWLRTLSVRGGGGHSSSSAQQGHLATSSLLGLQLQHSKPPS